MQRVILFSSFAFNSNLEQVLEQLFPEALTNKRFAYMPANGVKKYDKGIINYWEETAQAWDAEFYLIDNSPAQNSTQLAEQTYHLEKANILLISDGDPYKLLSNLRETQLDREIVAFWKQGNCVLAGFSAGAIILTPTINLYTLLAHTKDKYAQFTPSDLRGLNIVDFTVYPHYDKYRNKSVLDKYRQKFTTEIRILPDFHWISVEK